jgi:NAD(P)-dependent dehydrogenase (short-subunit alcohol dehydrogenase family)
LAQQGADVIVNYVSESSKALAEEVAKKVESHGSKTLVIQANLASVEDLDSLVKQSVARFGKIDILVNNGALVDAQPVGAIVSSMPYYIPIMIQMSMSRRRRALLSSLMSTSSQSYSFHKLWFRIWAMVGASLIYPA